MQLRTASETVDPIDWPLTGAASAGNRTRNFRIRGNRLAYAPIIRNMITEINLKGNDITAN